MTYSKNNPFLASIKQRYSLCKPGTKKNTQHIVLDIAGSGLSYNIGDSLAVLPKNDPLIVEKTLEALHATGKEVVHDRAKNPWTLREFLTSHANITEIHTKFLKALNLQDEKVHYYLYELLNMHPEVSFTPAEIASLLTPMLPRFYSIASSQIAVEDEIHLTVALLQYQADEKERLGVCTHYLCNLVPLHSPIVPIYVQPHRGFTLPENHDTPIIMIGPGTGVAPFRAFLQERSIKKAAGKNWLFFGEWHRETNFFYEEYWKELMHRGFLRLETAFSRDQHEKYYVQHAMHKHGKELFQWLEEGAHLYVCGDAQRMAKDVEKTLHDIVQQHGLRPEEEARHYVKQLRLNKRYLRDVY